MGQRLVFHEQVFEPGIVKGWLIRRGVGAFAAPETAGFDVTNLLLGQPALESVLINTLSFPDPTEDFSLLSPAAILLFDSDNLLAYEGGTSDQLKPFGRIVVGGTIFLREVSEPAQLKLGPPPQLNEEPGRRKIVAPSQRRPMGKTPSGLNPFELLLPILLPPEGSAELEGLLLPSPLYDFQNGGIAFLGNNESALLGDDMGLGKTVQAIVALRLLVRTGRIRGGLIISNKAVLPQWKRHLVDWAPDVVWYAVDGLRDRRQVLWQSLSGSTGMRCHVLLATYETIRQDHELLSESMFDLVILDEVQRIKNLDIGITRAIKSLKAERRWGLSGTPLENRIEDLHSIFSFLKPGLVRESDLYPSTIRNKIAPYFLRRRKEDVLKDLPPKSVQDQWLDLSTAQRRAYDDAERAGIVRLKDGVDLTVQHVLALITRLKQICNFDPQSGEGAKADFVLSHIDEIVDGGHKVILFSQYVETLNILREKLKKYTPLLYTGGLADKQREAVIRTFKQDASSQILLLSLKAGGVGLDLPEANFVFHYDLWWNPAVQRQAEDRVHRIGQTKPVFVRRLLTADTIEARIDEILRRKAQIFNETIEGLADVDLKQSLTEDELFGLFGLKPPRKVAEDEAKRDWQKIDGVGFERLVAKLYEAMGYVSQVTRMSRDGGIDIECWRQQATGVERIMVQCKHWPDGLVGESPVRDLYGALSARQEMHRAELVTTGRISRDARQWAHGKRIRLVDGVELEALLTKYGISMRP